jgi:hypothetical protein
MCRAQTSPAPRVRHRPLRGPDSAQAPLQLVDLAPYCSQPRQQLQVTAVKCLCPGDRWQPAARSGRSARPRPSPAGVTTCPPARRAGSRAHTSLCPPREPARLPRSRVETRFALTPSSCDLARRGSWVLWRGSPPSLPWGRSLAGPSSAEQRGPRRPQPLARSLAAWWCELSLDVAQALVHLLHDAARSVPSAPPANHQPQQSSYSQVAYRPFIYHLGITFCHDLQSRHQIMLFVGHLQYRPAALVIRRRRVVEAAVLAHVTIGRVIARNRSASPLICQRSAPESVSGRIGEASDPPSRTG